MMSNPLPHTQFSETSRSMTFMSPKSSYEEYPEFIKAAGDRKLTVQYKNIVK